MAKYRVLSIDGGGIKGLLTTVILQRIVATPGLEDFLDSVDMIAGTSTGGLISLSIAHEVDLGKILGADYEIKGLRRELKKLLVSVTFFLQENGFHST